LHDEPNTSDNEYFGDIVAEAVSRRSLLKGGAAAALVLVAGRWVSPADAQAAGAIAADNGALTFTAVVPNEIDDVVVPNGYDYKVTARWGDPLFPDAPEFDFENQTARAQAKQFGYNCDYVSFIPLPDDRQGRPRGLLVVNHEYTDSELMFRNFDPTGTTPEDLERIQIELMAHGMSVVEVVRGKRIGAYKIRRGSRFNRRITATTPMTLTGPAAGHDWLKTSADPTGTRVLGTLNNCAGGTTPWGTVLSAEENFNQYFANAELVTDEAKMASHDRYGLPEGP
jgi:secreted PhoX family phosphatase